MFHHILDRKSLNDKDIDRLPMDFFSMVMKAIIDLNTRGIAYFFRTEYVEGFLA